jgi:hypothetical protein
MTPALERLIPWLACGYVVASDYGPSAELIEVDIRQLNLDLSEAEVAELTAQLQRPDALRAACIEWRMAQLAGQG